MAKLQDYNSALTTVSNILLHETSQISQSFIPTQSYPLSIVSIKNMLRSSYISRLPYGDILLNIYTADAAHKPTGSSLGQVTLPVSSFLNSYTIGLNLSVFFIFETPVQLTASTEYCLVLTSPDTTKSAEGYWNDHERYYAISYIPPLEYPSSYVGYAFSSSNGSIWTALTGTLGNYDLAFECYSDYEMFETFDDGAAEQVTAGAGYWVGQVFQASDNYMLKSIRVKLAKESGQDVGLVNVHVRLAIGGVPSGEDLASGYISNYNVPTTTLGWRDIDLTTAIKLTSGVDYCFLISATNATANKLYVGSDVGENGYASGTEIDSDDADATWTAVAANDLLFKIFGNKIGVDGSTLPSSDAITTKKLYAIGSNQFWYENRDGDMIVLTDSVGQLDTSAPLSSQEAYGKVYIVNGKNLKVADFVNIKITTTNIGSHPPDFATLLTGSISGAEMVVDYVNAIAGAVTIYGRRITSYPFQNETVTGLDNDSNAISFTGTAEVLPPHWYDWTVFGNSTNFGVIPDTATLVSLYNGRLVLAGNNQYPHEWWMSKSYEPHNFLYNQDDILSAVSAGSTQAGKVADIITALIPYGDDFFLFGCQSSMYLLDGDPTIGGTIENLADYEGVYGSKSWTKDSENNLYTFSGIGLHKSQGGRTKPQNLSTMVIPNWAKDWELDPSIYKIVLSYIPDENAIIISRTSSINGNNRNFYYSLKTGGFYPIILPNSCGLFSTFYYNSIGTTKRLLVLGCSDGYLRSFDRNSLNDIDTDDTALAIDSFISTPILKFNDNDTKGKLQSMEFELGSGSGTVSYELYVEDEAESVLDAMNLRVGYFKTGTISTTGKSVKIRPRARGFYGGILFYNNTVSESFILNRVDAEIIKAGD